MQEIAEVISKATSAIGTSQEAAMATILKQELDKFIKVFEVVGIE